ncbi:MAG: M1 family metallopeptidase [Lewinellaceae bacterium]|nr:M1 family metallopeptidase [Lewinellaceae bacterium]
MVKTTWLLLLLLGPLCASQAQKSPYFQQSVDYRIQISLNDNNHTLSGNIAMDYTNHAPEALPEIWMHLWGNAFKNRKTAFCQQKLRAGDTEFYFAPDSTLGYYTELDFSVDGQRVNWLFDPANPDIAVLKLDKPLPSGGTITISTPFTLKIPASFSRLGHVETSYQITQWYPKPAVYDNRGWHAMPYLDQGEFYSEFGSYDVTITLPDNYVVGATGVLLTPSESAFLAQKAAETAALVAEWEKEDPPKGNKRVHAFPASSPNTKTLHYQAEKVHDFAWFADKRFHVLRDTAVLASGKTVDCWALFTDEQRHLWTKGAFYVKRSVEFLSNTVGEYPWPQATAVHSALSAGGGMEYPMITVIGDSGSGNGLDEVITHEVGHNWFYGILASNERAHPWMDEGMNSYYEQRYMRKYYGKSDIANIKLPKKIYNPDQNGSILEIAYLYFARDRQDTPPDSDSDQFSSVGYGIQVYMKTAMCMRWLEGSLGIEQFDKMMQDYYQRWNFKHPYPEDVAASFSNSGVDAGWFFQTMQTQHQADMAVTAKPQENPDGDGFLLKVKNKGSLAAPFPISAMEDGKVVSTQWYPALQTKEQTIDFKTDGHPDGFIIDAEHRTLELNRRNNQTDPKPIQVGTLLPIQNPSKNQLGILPWLGWNNYDKAMVGLVFYNPPLPLNRFQYYLAPGIGLGSKNSPD